MRKRRVLPFLPLGKLKEYNHGKDASIHSDFEPHENRGSQKPDRRGDEKEMTSSTFTICEAFEEHLPEIAELFRRHDYGPKNVDWLRWKYLRNPDGTAKMYVAKDADGDIVGFQAFLPRRFSSARSGTFEVLHCVDVFVEKELRKEGVYSQLSIYCGRLLTEPRIAFPNKSSLSFGLRNGYQITGDVETWWFPVLVGKLFEGKPYSFVAPLADLVAKLYTFLRLGPSPSNVKIKPLERFDRDFDLDPEKIHGVRSAEYLNWRFIDNPMDSYTVCEFIEDGESIGYCSYRTAGSSAEIYDFVVAREHKGCLRLLVERCLDDGVSMLLFRGVGLKLRGLGFLRKYSDDKCTTRDVPPGHWMVTLCDRDV